MDFFLRRGSDKYLNNGDRSNFFGDMRDTMTAEWDGNSGSSGKRPRRNQSQSNFFVEDNEDDVRNISPPVEDNFARTIRQNDKHFSKLDLEHSHDEYIQRSRQGSDDCSTRTTNTTNTGTSVTDAGTVPKPEEGSRTVRRFFKYDYGWFVPVDR